MSLLPLATLGDRIGYRRILLGGLCLFILASVGCALSRQWLSLVLWRALQGLGAAGVMCVGGAMTRLIYPPERLGRGIGLNAMIVASSAAAAPTIGALLLSGGHWPLIFAVNVPLGVLALGMGLRWLPRNRIFSSHFDVTSALLCAAFIGSTLMLIDSNAFHPPRGVVVVCALVTLCIAIVFIYRQRGSPHPLVPFDLLVKPVFGLSVLANYVSFSAQLVAAGILPFLFHSHLDFTVLETGMVMSVWPLSVIATIPLAGRLADRKDAQASAGLGLILAAVGFVLVAFVPPKAAIFDVIWRMALCGIGFGLFQSPNMRVIIGSAPDHRVGSVSGLIGTIRLCGQTTGASLAAVALGAGVAWPILATPAPAAILTVLAAVLVLARVRAQHKQIAEQG